MVKIKYVLMATLAVCLFGGFSIMSPKIKKDERYVAEGLENTPNVKLFEGRTGKIEISELIDLKNQECVLPEGVTLVFKNGGRIINGKLVGKNTKIKYNGIVFERVHITGTWLVPRIKTSMFADLDYENSLKDVMALSNPEVRNVIVIEKGDYQVTATKNEDVCLPVNSNTKLTINGTIRLTPNNFRNYYIIQAIGENLVINGSGIIIGDKFTHTGKDGEWGMGIELRNAHNALIKGLSVKDCWGDCIYIGDGSSNVRIANCSLDNGRRQGISITAATDVTIKNCLITNVGGTNPEYAIDVEPNKGETVRNVIIEKVISDGCKGGFLVWGKATNAVVDGVVIKSSRVSAFAKCPISLETANNISVNNCVLDTSMKRTYVSCKNVTNGNVINNKFSIKPTLQSTLRKIVRRKTDEDSQVITTHNCNNITIADNVLAEHE